MKMLSLLGKSLKNDEVIELLEAYDVDVIYAFDRLHENSPDVYWASINDLGLQLRFDESQRLDTIFCHVLPREGFGPILTETIGVPIFDSYVLAEQACRRDGLQYKSSSSPGAWLKILTPGHDAHYQFKDGRLAMVTLMLSVSAQNA
ncbi:hypothetical protein [Arenimonas sp.]|uniref:hypothetical protein n=1 Tax=Arenimonas sp. TaxID=1872635 RepID=UPI0039E6A5CC